MSKIKATGTVEKKPIEISTNEVQFMLMMAENGGATLEMIYVENNKVQRETISLSVFDTLFVKLEIDK